MAKEKVLYALAENPKDVYDMFYNAVTSIFPSAKLSKSMPRGYEVKVRVRGTGMSWNGCTQKFREVRFTHNRDIGQGLVDCMTHQMHVQQSIATVESLFEQLQKIKKTFSKKGNRKIEVTTNIRNPVTVTDATIITKDL